MNVVEKAKLFHRIVPKLQRAYKNYDIIPGPLGHGKPFQPLSFGNDRSIAEGKGASSMYRILDDSVGHTIGMKVEGKLTKEDYEVLIPYFENLIHECGALNLLCDMTHSKGMETRAFWEDFTFRVQHLRDFSRIAIVGDYRWMDWYTKVVDPLMNPTLRYFPLEHMNEAWTWVGSDGNLLLT